MLFLAIPGEGPENVGDYTFISVVLRLLRYGLEYISLSDVMSEDVAVNEHRTTQEWLDYSGGARID